MVLVIVDGEPADAELARLRDIAVQERRARMTDGGADTGQQLAGAKGLFDIVICAHVQRRDLVALVRARRDDDDRQVRPRAHLAQDVEPVHVGKPEIENDEVRAVGRDHRQRILPAGGNERIVAVGGQDGRDEVADALLVLDDEHLILDLHVVSPPSGADSARQRSLSWNRCFFSPLTRQPKKHGCCLLHVGLRRHG